MDNWNVNAIMLLYASPFERKNEKNAEKRTFTDQKPIENEFGF